MFQILSLTIYHNNAVIISIEIMRIRANPFIHMAKFFFSPLGTRDSEKRVSIDTICMKEKKRRSLKSKRYGKLKREAAARGGRCGFAPGWHFCIYVFMRFTLALLSTPVRMIKNKHAQFFAISHRCTRDVPNKKNRPMGARGCGNTCHKFTVMLFSAGSRCC